MATNCTIGTVKDTWRFSGARTSNSLSLPSSFNYVDVTSTPANAIVIPTSSPLEVSNTIVLSFVGGGSSAPSAGDVCRARIWGLAKFDAASSNARATYLADLDIRLGTMPTTSNAPFNANPGALSNGLYADLVTASVNRTLTPPGISAMGGYQNAAADIAFDTYGFSYLIIETDIGSDGIGQVGFLYRFG